jgi:hypothetical protein
MLLSRHSNAGQNYAIKIDNRCFENVAKFRYLGTTITNWNIKTIILPVVLYGCETWSLILREEHKLRVFENRVLRRILGSKRDEVTGDWRKLHNEELPKLYSSPNIISMVN